MTVSEMESDCLDQISLALKTHLLVSFGTTEFVVVRLAATGLHRSRPSNSSEFFWCPALSCREEGVGDYKKEAKRVLK